MQVTIGNLDGGMDILEFIASLVSSLAWPLAAVLISILFRSQFRGLLERLRSFTVGGTTAEFRDELGSTEQLVERLEPTKGPEPPPIDFQAPLDPVPAVIPSAAIMTYWSRIEQVLQELAVNRGYSDASNRSALYLSKRLQADGILDEETATILSRLRELRNRASHGDSDLRLSPDDARRFRDLAEVAVARITSSFAQ
jgi:hypothetical protein